MTSLWQLRARRRTLSAPNLIQMLTQLRLFELRQRQRNEQIDTILEVTKRSGKRGEPFHVTAADGGRVFDAPMRFLCVTGPDRTQLARGVVANSEDEIHLRRAGHLELVPTLRAIAL